MHFTQKDILDMASLSAEEITHILDTAQGMKEISLRPVKKVPTLRGKTLILFFHEASTRTKTSFDIAGKRLSADVIALAKSGSSMAKGESLLDTVKTLEAMHPDVVVMRHGTSGAAQYIAGHLKSPVINAGDGKHAHPTQALLDMMTIRERKGRLAGLKVAIIGDIAHSRVARSNMEGLIRMGAEVRVAGPPTMIPKGVEEVYGVKVFSAVEGALEGADVVMMLRIQKERMENILFASEREYARTFGLSTGRLALAHPDALVLHPGPMNRGVEITDEVADGHHSVILDQVENGVALRMALFYLLAGGMRHADED
ncbi:aspartate carbamoyltransferase catalytic subunit [Desulfobotulus sp. H1]|uniref:Aspartate carbamoyltransferase n=1 Tax=Desulfobotulus pelophilus TaxID=2823377 RepID=A0ABT3N5U3_9BACT|nr:aspartate carbamoyltransferase catalytic subunit [Desulfobotulus pelophilus]MCW7752833.1 aspartate carbamoyltransferase catalytic subunit [Desulfobotulus pelophilus]